MKKKNKLITLMETGEIIYSHLPAEKRPQFICNLTYDELEIMAFDRKTPDYLAHMYQDHLIFLRAYMPNEAFRRERLNRDGSHQLQLYDNGHVWYCD